ncbi:uncharacterized protein LOC328695 [Mus musculus]|uniref:Ferritin n=1 Tax=Mus musculus TaxID=10090 RepID=Q3UWK9_MOUSE|nr:uncharacterized protein LOC328695 [Mus musculus]AAI45923.1 Gene model 813, (NCBI) [Mus musculus]AAI45925.1 Gene model 813, (NCBI) [Mus musculus]BAE22905.1 unnamed protein product [Mus musculus]|eukprot:NP_001028576.1 uncharacterized protein LOC328695 [Mus musculus]
MGPKRRKPIPEEALAYIHRIACMQMNLSDAYMFLACLYSDDTTMTSFGAYSQDKASVKWFYAKRILAYITERGNKVCIPEIQRPEIDTQGCIQCAIDILNMENELTEILHDLQDVALTVKDNTTITFTKELIYTQRRNEDRLALEIVELRRKEKLAQEEDDKNKRRLKGTRKKPRR